MKQHLSFWPISGLVALWFFASCSPEPLLQGSLDGLVPAPKNLEKASGSWVCRGQVSLVWPETWSNEGAVVASWFETAGIEREDNPDPDVRFELEASISGKEAYHLQISPSGIVIQASTEAGLFRGWMTLRKMCPVACETGCASGFSIPSCSVQDAPDLEHRGLLLDGCRHFQEVDFVLKQIDNLALHGMNVLHWHLTEDQGWRIDVPALPELAQVGAWRTEADGAQHGGVYSASDIQKVVSYAAARHIEVIPEIEMPGHSSAALAAYPELGCSGDSVEVPRRWGVFKDIYCAGNEGTFEFLETVLEEVVRLFPGPRIHIGGDEAPKVRWSQCPKCQKRMEEEGLANEEELQRWFIGRMGAHLATKGKTIIGWDEILEGGLPEGAAVQSWRGMDGAAEAVHLGADVIVSPTSHCYLDYPLRSTDMEEAYAFEPVPDSLAHGPGRILGGEGNMWTEHAPQERVESKIYPRLTALAEVFWSGHGFTGRPGAYADFLRRLDHHYNRLDALGVAYGLESPPFGLTTSADDQGGLLATVKVKGRGVRCRGEWTGNGHSVTADVPVSVKGPGALRLEVGRRGTWTGQEEVVPLDGHDAVFRDVELAYTPSPWYTGGGETALVDGRLGSADFRDGTWQARQGGDMRITVDLGAASNIASLETGSYLYQDAWIFLPETVVWEGSMDGVQWNVLASASTARVLDRDDRQQRATIQGEWITEGRRARHVRMTAKNAGPCPDWHAASGSASWLFLDECVIRTQDSP